jgi:hypothetical protein
MISISLKSIKIVCEVSSYVQNGDCSKLHKFKINVALWNIVNWVLFWDIDNTRKPGKLVIQFRNSVLLISRFGRQLSP